MYLFFFLFNSLYICYYLAKEQKKKVDRQTFESFNSNNKSLGIGVTLFQLRSWKHTFPNLWYMPKQRSEKSNPAFRNLVLNCIWVEDNLKKISLFLPVIDWAVIWMQLKTHLELNLSNVSHFLFYYLKIKQHRLCSLEWRFYT